MSDDLFCRLVRERLSFGWDSSMSNSGPTLENFVWRKRRVTKSCSLPFLHRLMWRFGRRWSGLKNPAVLHILTVCRSRTGVSGPAGKISYF